MLPRSTHAERNCSYSGSIACFKMKSIGNLVRSIVPSAVIQGGVPSSRFPFMITLVTFPSFDVIISHSGICRTRQPQGIHGRQQHVFSAIAIFRLPDAAEIEWQSFAFKPDYRLFPAKIRATLPAIKPVAHRCLAASMRARSLCTSPSVSPRSGWSAAIEARSSLLLTALAFIRGASLRADQCLGRSGAFKQLRHVQAMMVDLLVQMLTALLPYAEAMRLGGGIKSEGLQFTTVVTSADNLHVLPPVLGRLGRLLAAGQQKLGGMRP